MTAVLRDLRRRVIDLDETNTEEQRKALADAIKGDITDIDLSTFSEHRIAELCAICFQKTAPSIVAHLNNSSLSSEQGATSTKVLLDVLTVAVDLFDDRDKLTPHTNAVVNCCLRFLMRFKDGAFKHSAEAAADLVAQLLSRKIHLDSPLVEKLCESVKLLIGSKLDSSENKRTLYELGGTICRHFAVEADRLFNVRQLISLMVAELRQSVNSKYKTPNFKLVASAVHGLRGVLFHFSHMCDGAGKNSLESIYEMTKVWLNREVQLQRYGAVKAILQLYSDHAALFAEQFMGEYSLMYGWMCQWALETSSANKELKKAAYAATNAFLEQVAERFPDALRKNSNDAEAMLKYFLTYFERTLFGRSSVDSSSLKSICVAVKGLGDLSNAIRQINGDAAVNKLLLRVAERANQIFVESQDPIENRIFYLPQFIEPLSRMLRAATSVDEEFWTCVEHLQLLYFHHYPSVDFKQHYRSALVTYQLLVASLPHRPSFVNHLIRQTLLRIASTPVGEQETVSVTDYLPLWSLLSGRSTDDRLEKSEREHLCALIFHATVSATLSIVESLDLSVDKADDGSAVLSNPATRNDFLVFGNLVNFFCAFLDQSDHQLFTCWVWPLSQKLVHLAARFPHASGLFRMLSATVSSARTTGYFDSAVDTDARQCQLLLSQFADEALSRVVSLKDDVLFGVLHFILALPPQMIADRVDGVAEALNMALKLGLSYLPLAAMCLDALELWVGVLDKNKREQLCSSVLPVLDDYLRTESTDTGEGNSFEANKRRVTKATKEAENARLRGRITRESTEDVQIVKLVELRRRIALFLGNIGGSLNKYLLARTADETLKGSIAWDPCKHLPFDVPFSDAKVRIELDRFLPYICELATSSGNRQCKTAAAECLHSTVVYALGKHGNMTDPVQKLQPMDKLYRRLFPYLLRLCCDADQVPKQLFRPLVTQIIHWFATNQTYENRETVALIESLLEAIIDDNDASLRDYAANCIDEFLKWTIKQNQKDAMRNNAKSLLKRVCIFAEHPDPLKRLGAAVAFNAFYRTLRENDELVDDFGLHLLAVYFRSLLMAHKDPESAGTVEHCSKSIDHLQRMILGSDDKKSHHFDRLQTASKNRRLPKDWTDATVRGALVWLMKHLARPEAAFRRKAWDFVLAGVRLTGGQFKSTLDKLSGFRSVRDWIHKFEISLTPAPDKTQLSIDWLEILEATVDCYIQFLNSGYSVKLTDIFASNGSRNLIPAMVTFLRDFVLGQDSDDEWLREIGGRQRTKYNRIKCTVAVRILTLVQKIITLGSAEGILNSILPELWTDCLWHSVVRICVDAASIGFDMTDRQVLLTLPAINKQTCWVFAQKLPPNIRAQCQKSMDLQLQKHFPLNESVLDLLAVTDGSASGHLTAMLRRVEAHHMLADLKLTTFPLDPERLWRRLVAACFNSRSNVVQFPPTINELVEKLTAAAIRFGLTTDSIVATICDRQRVVGQLNGDDVAAATKGRVVCQRFGTQLTEAFACAPVEFFDCLLAASDLSSTIDTVALFLDCLGKNNQLRQRYGQSVNRAIASRWNKITDTPPMTVCRLLLKMLLVNSEFITITRRFNDETRMTVYQVPDNFESIFNQFCSILVDNTGTIPLSDKNKALMLLGVFALIPSGSGDVQVETFASRLKDSLDTFVSIDLPMSSSEFAEGTAERSRYLWTLQLLLRALSLSDSGIVLHVLVSILCREKSHVAHDEVSYLLNRYARRLSPTVFSKQLLVPLSVVLNELLVGASGEQLRLNALNRVLLPMLSGLSDEHLVVFYIDQVVSIMKSLANPSSSDTALTTKIACYKLLEVMYTRLELSVLKGSINNLYAPNDSDTALLKELVKCSKAARMQFAEEHSVRKWEYRCAAQNCLMAVVCKTQTNPDKIVNFYKEILFPAGVWRWLSNESHTYAFDMEFEQLPQRQKLLLRLRKAMRQGNDAQLGTPMSQGNSTLGFLSSQVLAGSSLHSQVSSTSQFDFTGSASQDPTVEAPQTSTAVGNDADQTAVDDEESEVLSMEMDELNEHPCMQPLVAALRHFCQLGDAVFDKTGAREPPLWMRSLWEQLDSSESSVNAKLLVWRLVGHLEQEFRPYAQRWLPSLIKSLSDESLGGPGLHCFRVDTLVTCLSWAATPSVTAMHDASRLLAYVIEHAAHENSTLLKRNVRLVQLMCECWKGISYRNRYLAEQLVVGSKDSSGVTVAVMAALQLTAVLLHNDVDPLACFDVDHEDYKDKVDKLFNVSLPAFLGHKIGKVRALAAEAVGLAFAFFKRIGIDPMVRFSSVKLQVSSLMRGGSSGSTFLSVLTGIAQHYPKFVISFKTDICSLLSKVNGDYKTKCLELACTLAADRDVDDLREVPLDAVRLMMTKASDPAARECALRLVKLMTNGRLSAPVIADLMPDVVSFVDYHHLPCRNTMIDTCIVLYDEHKSEAPTNEHSAKIFSMAKDCLLRCLSDSDSGLKQKVCNFWSHESRLPGDLTGRTVGLLQLAFSSSSDRQFLSDATYLILERCAKSPDFDRALFNNPLNRCDFQKLEVMTNWRRRNETLQTPVFAMTQKPSDAVSQLPATLVGVSGLQTMFTQRDADQHLLRATQAEGGLKFEQTLTQGQHFDWLSGNTYDDSSFVADTQFGRLGDQTSTAGGQRMATKRKLRPVDAKFGKKLSLNQSFTADADESDVADELRRMKRRILKDRNKTSDLYAKSGMRMRQSQRQADKEKRAASGQTVQLYRTYRYGDFPDIQIPCRALVAPLQALAKADAHIAALLFESLLDGVHKQAKDEEDWRPRLATAIQDVLRQSFVFGPVVSALLSFCHRRARELLIDPALIASAGVGSNQQMAAIAVLEQYLEERPWDRGEPTADKRRRANDPRSDDDESKVWLELAKVYKSIGDADMVRGIFEKKLNCLPPTKLGLEAEFRHDYESAIDIYEQALKEMDEKESLQSDFEFSEQQLIEESRLKCLNTLGEWSIISRIVGQMVDTDTGPNGAVDFDRIWTMKDEDSSSTSEERKKMCLSHLMRSNVRLILKNGLEQTMREYVQRFIDAERSWESDDQKRIFLESHFASDMALRSFAWQLNDEAAGHLGTALNNFLVEWPQMPQVLESSRLSLLATLQPIAQSFAYLHFVQRAANLVDLTALTTLCARWRDATVDDLTELAQWDDVVTSRCWFIVNIGERMRKTVIDQAVYQATLPAEIGNRLRYACAASAGGCFSLAEDQLKVAQKLLKGLSDVRLAADWTHAYAEVHLSSAAHHADKIVKAVEQVGKAADLLSMRLNQHPDDTETVRLMGIVCWRLAERFLQLDKEHWDELPAETKITAIHLTGLLKKEISLGMITSGLFDRADICLQRAAAAGTDDTAVLTFANFCNSYLSAKADNEAGKIDGTGKGSASLRTKRNAADYAQSLVGAILTAMRMGSAAARQLFPKLLNIIETFPDCRLTFLEQAKTVPAWMFLGWLNQIIALLDSPSAVALHDIVQRLSEEYPQAVIYPFNLSRQQWSLTDRERKEFVDKLDAQFETMTLVKSFVKSLELLSPPDITPLKYFAAELNSAEKQTLSTSKLAQMRDKAVELFRGLFAMSDECSAAEYSSAQPGTFWTEFCEKHSSQFRKDFGKLGDNIGDLLAKKQAAAKLSSFVKAMENDQAVRNPPSHLAHYSRWLADFNAADTGADLEIPGQYVGDKKPDPDLHIKIFSFDERVTVLPSITKPKRMTIRGNDGHEYRYLVKGGEDLRQDERIEQLFTLLNGLLVADPECKKRHLRIQTYRVIPLSSRLGLIEFVPNVKGVNEFLSDQMDEKELERHKNGHQMWLDFYDKKCLNVLANGSLNFEETVEKFGPDKAAKCLQTARRCFRPNLLRAGLQGLCRDATGAVLVQREMTRSHAVVCVAHYLLGIGDRHLNNIMIDISTGRFVGIDFGHAFGTGLFLAVPELVPFRLTQQFVEAMGPLGVDGHFTSAMRLCLSAVRNNKHLLLNTMDVFVKEPLINWQGGNTLVNADAKENYPQRKLEIAASKLAGRNPVSVMQEELKQGKRNKKTYLDQISIILCGKQKSTTSLRGFPVENLTVEQQTDCLVQLATDDAIVSRIFRGWEPWL